MAPANGLTNRWRISSLYLIPVSAPFLMMYNSVNPWVRRLESARDHADWQIAHLKSIHLTEKSKFYLDFNDGRRRMWIQKNECFNDCVWLNMIASVEVLLWCGKHFYSRIHGVVHPQKWSTE
jgi:hypothetical protein